MEACRNSQGNSKQRKYYRLPMDDLNSKVIEVEFLTEDDLKNTNSYSKITQFRSRNTTPNFVIESIHNKIRLNLFAQLVLVIGTSVATLICLIFFGKFRV